MTFTHAMLVEEFTVFVHNYLKYPYAILLIIPLIIILIHVLRKDYVKLKEEEDNVTAKAWRKRVQIIMIMTRILIFSLLIVAIASPFIEHEKTVEGDPYMKIIIDNTTSTQIFDQSMPGQIIEELGRDMKVEQVYINSQDRSAIGDTILSNIKVDENVLLITDGNNNFGSDIGDVALYSTKLNATLNAIRLQPQKKDISVKIKGPSKTLENLDNLFTVQVGSANGIHPYRLKLYLDDEVVIDQETSEQEIKFTRAFVSGYHHLKAVVESDDDFFPQNNVYYKTVKVVPKPKVLFYSSKESPMLQLLQQVYEVTPVVNLEEPMDDYHLLVVNDINAQKLDEQIDKITDYVLDGNGLFVIGGKDSFERGAYKDSMIETMLPVFVATPGKEEGDTNVVLVIDISGSTGSKLAVGGERAVDVEKALALSVLDNLKHDNKLGVVAFNTEGFIVSPMEYIFEKVGLADSIATLNDGGGTLIDTGILKAVDMLVNLEGSKNIILISDGLTYLAGRTVSATRFASDLGIKIYTIGVGGKTNVEMLKSIAAMTRGIYFAADQSNKIKILFGDAEEEESERSSLTILNENHFITEDLSLNGTVTGFNQIVPKSTANLLITTGAADPLLTVSRMGLGKVAVLTTDDGSGWAGQLLNQDNSKLITRIVNWAVGDLDRKRDEFIDIADTRINVPTEITVKSLQPPVSESVVFYKTGEDIYTGTITPEELGFQQILGATFGVNYEAEYEEIGYNKELETVVESTDGKVFDRQEVSEIVEYVRSRSKRNINIKEEIRWPFVLAAMVLLLIEIFIRKIIKNKVHTKTA